MHSLVFFQASRLGDMAGREPLLVSLLLALLLAGLWPSADAAYRGPVLGLPASGAIAWVAPTTVQDCNRVCTDFGLVAVLSSPIADETRACDARSGPSYLCGVLSTIDAKHDTLLMAGECTHSFSPPLCVSLLGSRRRGEEFGIRPPLVRCMSAIVTLCAPASDATPARVQAALPSGHPMKKAATCVDL